ncbi:pyruvate dehydrogenase (acetyl-transferring), homodimeric type, partial [Salmonella enterica]|nr:pyruvate dehydrogenase (acetyl-transferring), homodimeric type [Salmonella enterica]
YLADKLADAEGPVVAVSDWATQVPDQIREFVPGDFSVLGADGFGFSDTRAAARRHFAIDREAVVVKVLQRLAASGQIPADVPAEAIKHY